jgi:nitroimidazol reductase NimA-like FMN-containing flavoprotein (pyridoxamine 5'-phosphate oxidase superfamily)
MEKYHIHNRPDREIKDEVLIQALIKKGKYVTLSLCNNNQPYIVTLSYGYDHPTRSLYMHCANEGLKLDFIKANPNACGTLIEDGGYIQNECAHRYKTVVFFGKISILTDIEEKRKGMEILLNHLESEEDIIHAKVNSDIKLYQKLVILKFEIHEIHGKSGR